MSQLGSQFDAAQRAYDRQEPPDDDHEEDECEVCILHKYGGCIALGETNTFGDCPSFKD